MSGTTKYFDELVNAKAIEFGKAVQEAAFGKDRLCAYGSDIGKGRDYTAVVSGNEGNFSVTFIKAVKDVTLSGARGVESFTFLDPGRAPT